MEVRPEDTSPPGTCAGSESTPLVHARLRHIRTLRPPRIHATRRRTGPPTSSKARCRTLDTQSVTTTQVTRWDRGEESCGTGLRDIDNHEATSDTRAQRPTDGPHRPRTETEASGGVRKPIRSRDEARRKARHSGRETERSAPPTHSADSVRVLLSSKTVAASVRRA